MAPFDVNPAAWESVFNAPVISISDVFNLKDDHSPRFSLRGKVDVVGTQ